jgi:hypothetical protein
MTVDKYKEKYKIPWGYSLICSDSSQLYAKAMKGRMDNGYEPPLKIGEEQKRMIEKDKRICPFRREITLKSLGDYIKPKHPLSISPTGELETFTAKRERETAKKGTKAFSQKMRDRPQCQPGPTRKRFSDYWRGRKQTPEHIAKRFKNRRNSSAGEME